MCWNQPASFVFASLGTILACISYYRTRKLQFFLGCMYFVAMEFLQFFQYFWIDQCDNWMNKFLTLLGLLHIIFQPFFCHLVNSCTAECNEAKGNKFEKAMWKVVLRLCIAGALLLAFRFGLGAFYHSNAAELATCPTQEWIVGDKVCTYKGTWHLAWSFPAYPAGYLMQGGSLHAFLMFVPFFVINVKNIPAGLLLVASGPLLSYALTNNPQEQPAVWCFFSIVQIIAMAIMAEFVYPGLMSKKAEKKEVDGEMKSGETLAVADSETSEKAKVNIFIEKEKAEIAASGTTEETSELAPIIQK